MLGGAADFFLTFLENLLAERDPRVRAEMAAAARSKSEPVDGAGRVAGDTDPW